MALSFSPHFSPRPTMDQLLDQFLNEEVKFPTTPPQIQITSDETMPCSLLHQNNDLLTVPHFRQRSPSIASSTSSKFIDTTSINDSWSEYGSDIDELSPFPGSTVVQVPSPWIRAINSPLTSPTHSVFSDSAFQNFNLNSSEPVNYISFHSFQEQNQYPLSMGVEHTLNPPHSPLRNDAYQPPFLQANYQGQQQPYIGDTNEFFRTSDLVDPQLSHTPQIELDSNGQPKLTVPDGRFWNVVKQNGTTLYQCPWDACGKSITY